MSKIKRVNINSLFLTIIIGVGGFALKETYRELRATHDDVIRLQKWEQVQDEQIHELKTGFAKHDAEILKLKARKL